MIVIVFQRIEVSVPNPTTDGAKTFEIPTLLWDLW